MRPIASGRVAGPTARNGYQSVCGGGSDGTRPIAGTSVLPAGVTHWQCCLHPWMRMNIAVRDHGHEDDQEQEHEHQH